MLTPLRVTLRDGSTYCVFIFVEAKARIAAAVFKSETMISVKRALKFIIKYLN